MVAVSLVIPTYNRPRLVMQALESAQAQRLPTFELIVVDNAADAELRRGVETFNANARVPATYVPEARLGLHNARHAGARAASGDVLVFTDDDATFDPGWLAAYAHCFDAHPTMMAAGGPVRPVWEAPPPPWLVDLLRVDPRMFPALSLLELSDIFQLSRDGIFFGVNMAVRRDALFAAGGFNPEIFGDRWLGDGETGLQRALCARGMLIGYVPDALVLHQIPATRMTLRYLRRRQANDGACDMYAAFHPGVPGPAGLLYVVSRIIFDGARDLVAAAVLRGRTDGRSIRVQLRAARAWSRLEYTWRLMFSKDLRTLVERTDWLQRAA
jgi:glucosyl-dolichyl phosphate glucuronosyltransferase